MKTALPPSVTCKLKCTGFYANLDLVSPVQYPDIAFSYGILGNKATCIKMLFLMQCVFVNHTLVRELSEQGAR